VNWARSWRGNEDLGTRLDSDRDARTQNGKSSLSLDPAASKKKSFTQELNPRHENEKPVMQNTVVKRNQRKREQLRGSGKKVLAKKKTCLQAKSKNSSDLVAKLKLKRENPTADTRCKIGFPLRIDKITTNSHRLPLSHAHLIIGIKNEFLTHTL
jgi:hypothetical protein